ncbi:hypothetical protein BC938DRAFT_472472 [Jimgerdemannia flammicorona]|uniref:Magnesium transporter NIPA-domain-containing protein n=1 Tax=Jimgerdemannia flammicorona TaxID=994334 RepID=A0A433Q622_9FUNG|nr:hypothetical protein BC938DRAFT_472472 [Jimgerdemannia flammicorona]
MFIVGILFALTGNVVIGLGNCLQKFALTRAQQNSTLPLRHQRSTFDLHPPVPRRSSQPHVVSPTGLPHHWFYRTVWNPLIQRITSVGSGPLEPGKPYSRFQDKLWWTGFALTFAGEAFGNWVALSMISASTVTPLGIVGVMVNAFLARDLLGETVTRRQREGYVWILAGVGILLWATAQSGGGGIEDAMGGEVSAQVDLDETVEDTIVRGGPHALVFFMFSQRVMTWCGCLLVGLAVLGYRVWGVWRLERLVRETGAAKIAADGSAVLGDGNGKRAALGPTVRSVAGTNGTAVVYHQQSMRVLTLYVLLTASFGAVVVMTSKLLALLLRCWVVLSVEEAQAAQPIVDSTISDATTAGSLSPMTQSLTFILLATVLIVAVVLQETGKQLTLQSFPLTQFQPMFYAAHVALVTVSSLALFDRAGGRVQVGGVITGILVIVKGGSVLLGTKWNEVRMANLDLGIVRHGVMRSGLSSEFDVILSEPHSN